MQVFDVFRDNQISVDVVATSEISVSLTLDQRQAVSKLTKHHVFLDCRITCFAPSSSSCPTFRSRSFQ